MLRRIQEHTHVRHRCYSGDCHLPRTTAIGASLALPVMMDIDMVSPLGAAILSGCDVAVLKIEDCGPRGPAPLTKT